MKQIKYLPINWSNGLKLSGQHFIDAHLHMVECFQHLRAEHVTEYNYGIGMPLEHHSSSVSVEVVGAGAESSTIRLNHCNAITLGGSTIVFEPELYGSFSPELTLSDLGKDAADGGVYIAVTASYDRLIPVGYPDPNEIPLRHPHRQYQESNFAFIQRLARQHFEWLYYDGEKLIFGKPELPPSITLDSKRDLNSLDICIQTGARALSSFAHLSGSNNTLKSSSPDEPTGLNKLGQHAFQESIKMFGPPANHYATSRVTNKGELDTYLQKKQQSDASMSHFITAESDYVGLMLGSIVDIKSTVQVAGVSYKEELLGAYLITEIVHFAEGDGGYSCQFTAIPASVRSLPTPDVPLPIAQPQMATVISNDDPKKQGRVQVRMNWQVNGMKTSWVRVLSPDAGGSEKVSSNRGFVFIPEVGDQVMVAFRYNDPNRPYIQGSLFNGTNGGGGGADNNVKSLTTRSGVAVTLDDSKGSVLIKDKAGNSYAADGAGNIKIESSQTITFTCKDSSITLKEDGNILLDGKILTLNGKDSISLNSKAIDSTAAETNTMNGNDVTVQGNVTATLSGTSKTDVDSMGITSVSGTLVKLN